MNVAVRNQKRGFAVIVALVAVTVLTILAGAFAYAMQIEARLAANTSDDEEFYWMGRGGVERACWWLALEGGQPYSSTQQYWAGGPGDGPETNSVLAGESLADFKIGKGAVSLKMTEQESKININTVDGTLLQQALTAQGADANQISVVSDSILDWREPGDMARPAGAKTDYYLGQVPSYNCKCASFDNLDELMLVKGVTRAMYYGGSEGGADTPFPTHQLGFGHAPGEEANYAFGLRDVFTPFGAGKVNILTASDQVLELIPGMTTSGVQAIRNALNSDPPIRNISQLLSVVGVDPSAASQLMNYVSLQGNTYEVQATATIGSISHQYTAIVIRNGPNMQIVSFYRSQ